MEQALFSQLTKLEGDRVTLERAAEVCRALERSGVEYAALDPQPYLQQLEAPPHPALPNPPSPTPKEVPDNTPRACYHPWQRYFARVLDVGLYNTLFNVLWIVLLRDLSLWEFQRRTLGGWIFDLALLAFSLAVEPLWLHYLGWTPGKWLFGLKLRDENGEKLTIAQGWERSWRVFRDGYGWDIPFWDLWTMWQCRKMGLDGWDCWWDGTENYRYTKVERRFDLGVVYVLLVALLVVGQFTAQCWAALPRNRGDLTVAEFSQNYNQFHDRFSELGFSSIPELDHEGRWIEDTEPTAVSHTSSASITENGVTHTIVNPVEGTKVWSQPEFTLEDGRITAVTIRWESRDSIVSSGWLREQLVLMAMSGASPKVTLFHFNPTEWYCALWNLPDFEDQELDFQGLHISQQVDYEGYIPVGSGTSLWTENENAPCHFEKSVTISVP